MYRENAIKKRMLAGGKVNGCWLHLNNAIAAEIIALAGFDAVIIDHEHGSGDFLNAISLLQAVSATPATAIMRVPWNDPAAIMKLLDAGAYGIICPMINTAEECERFVGACRYAPVGYRSFGPARGLLYGGPDYAAEANTTITTMAMIETEQAVDNLDEILAVDGLDSIYVGPNDLAISLGNPPNPEPVAANVIEAVDTIVKKTRERGLGAGIHCPSGASARDKIEKGFNFVTIANDARLMAQASIGEIKLARGDNA